MLINGRFLGRRVTGVQRFAREIINAAGQIGLLKGASIAVPNSDEYGIESYADYPVHTVGTHQGHRWEQFDLPCASEGEFLINLCSTAPVVKEDQLVVLHDIIFARYPRNFTFAFRTWYQIMTRLYARTARVFATVSKHSAAEIASYYNIPLSKIEVIPESGEHILQHESDYSLHEKFGLETDSYFIAVSSMTENKNFRSIVKAVQERGPSPFKFVVVGGSNARIFGAKTMDLHGAIEVGYVSDGQLRALYENAACFVFPSFYEGFGLPPLEAMCCGCPVLVSNTTALPETCGQAALYCDPYSTQDIGQKLATLLRDAAMREDLRAKGLEHVKSWTWAKAAHVLDQIVQAKGN